MSPDRNARALKPQPTNTVKVRQASCDVSMYTNTDCGAARATHVEQDKADTEPSMTTCVPHKQQRANITVNDALINTLELCCQERQILFR